MENNNFQKIELLEKYDSVISEFLRSNSRFPHYDKKDDINRYGEGHFWMTNYLVDKLYLYRNFYDRSALEILKKSEGEILLELHNKYIKFCRDYPTYSLREYNKASEYYIQPLISISLDYRLSLKLDNTEPDLLIPKNFFKVIRDARAVYIKFGNEVKEKLGCVEYFTDDIIEIVLSYSF